MAGCQGCRNGTELGFDFTMAFQPIVDLSRGTVWGYEALVRGASGEGAGHVLSRVTEDNRYVFDQACRVKAIEMAGGLLPDDGCRLSINFMPGAVYEPKACIRASLAAAERVGLERSRLMFEFTENERISDVSHIQTILREYRKIGFTTALDDFGAGYAGLNLLARFQPDLIKIDMDLVRDIATVPAKQIIVAGIVAVAQALSITVLAEGIETESEAKVLLAAGIRLQQGYYFARPEIGRLPAPAHLRGQPLLETGPTLSRVA
jgi:EAL domain-containing protein (putative c-di-GMP-specific phosphodiesterase class I)